MDRLLAQPVFPNSSYETELVRFGVGEHNPVSVTFFHPPHQLSTESHGPFSGFVRVGNVQVDMTAAAHS